MFITVQFRILVFTFCCIKNLETEIHNTVFLPVGFCGCEIWSLTLREEYRLRVMKGIFGLKREEVAVGWRRLHNEELHNVYISPITAPVIKLRRVRLAGM
jgi:hypothetical protein